MLTGSKIHGCGGGCEGGSGDAGSISRERHDQHYSGEGETGEAGHDADVLLRRVVDYPRISITLSRAPAAHGKHGRQANSSREEKTGDCPHLGDL